MIPRYFTFKTFINLSIKIRFEKQNVSLNQNQLIIQSEDKDSVSKMIVEACYKNNWQLILLQNQVVTLDSLYRQLVKGEKS